MPQHTEEERLKRLREAGQQRQLAGRGTLDRTTGAYTTSPVQGRQGGAGGQSLGAGQNDRIFAGTRTPGLEPGFGSIQEMEEAAAASGKLGRIRQEFIDVGTRAGLRQDPATLGRARRDFVQDYSGESLRQYQQGLRPAPGTSTPSISTGGNFMAPGTEASGAGPVSRITPMIPLQEEPAVGRPPGGGFTTIPGMSQEEIDATLARPLAGQAPIRRGLNEAESEAYRLATGDVFSSGRTGEFYRGLNQQRTALRLAQMRGEITARRAAEGMANIDNTEQSARERLGAIQGGTTQRIASEAQAEAAGLGGATAQAKQNANLQKAQLELEKLDQKEREALLKAGITPAQIMDYIISQGTQNRVVSFPQALSELQVGALLPGAYRSGVTAQLGQQAATEGTPEKRAMRSLAREQEENR